MRAFERYLGVPANRFKIRMPEPGTEFQDDGWFHLPFTVLFPDYEGVQGGSDVGITWRIRRDRDGWTVKTSTDGDEYPLNTEKIEHSSSALLRVS